MKKILLLMVSLFTFTLTTQVSNATTYTEGIKDSKPMALLIYADWADNASDMIGQFKIQEAKYGKLYNFVLLNIASADTREFNKKYHIYPNLPYVLLYKDGERFKFQNYSKYIENFQTDNFKVIFENGAPRLGFNHDGDHAFVSLNNDNSLEYKISKKVKMLLPQRTIQK